MDTDRRTVLRATAGVAAAGALPGLAQDEEVIRIGSDIPYKPFEFRTQDGTLTGFDVDVADAVFAGVLGREYEFVQTSFDTIIPSLNNGNFRVIMSAMTITDERDERVDFSNPYFVAYQTVAILAGSDIDEIADLEGQTVAVQKGTTGEAAAEELQEEFGGDLTIDSYDQIPGAFNALLNGQAVAVINDNSVNLQYTIDNENIVLLEGEGVAAEEGESAPPYLTLTVEEYGIAFREDDDEFREEVNQALATVIEDGTYAELYGKYFTGDPPARIVGDAEGTTEGEATGTTAGGETTAAETATETATSG